MGYNDDMAHNDKGTPQSLRFTTQIGARGRLVLPAAVRKQLALHEGDRVVLSLEPDGSMRLVSLREQARKAAGLYQHVAPGISLAEDLIKDRREEARREDES